MRVGGILTAVGFVLGAVLVGGGHGQVSCPPPVGNVTVLLPDPTDCTKYYVCDNGNPVSMDCPPPLVFDPTKNYCESPSLYLCTVSTPGVSTTTTSATTTTSRPTSTSTAKPPVECGNSTGVHLIADPDDEECRRYYTCVDGELRPELQECPLDLLFDPLINSCNLPERVDCPGAPTTRPPSTTTTRPTTTTSTTAPTTTRTTTTPAPSTTSTGVPTTTGRPGFPDCDPQVPSTHPYPGNCTLYIVCVHGSMTLYQCPKDMAFDSVSKECKPTAEAVCASISTPLQPVLQPVLPQGDVLEGGVEWEVRREERRHLGRGRRPRGD